jgi:thioredoxin reductase
MTSTELRGGAAAEVPPPRAFDVVVVGGGPAGLSAGLWAARYRRRTAIVDAGAPRNAATEATHGYLGWDGAPPDRLRAAALRDIARYPGLHLFDRCRVTGVRRRHDDLFVTLEDGGVLSARRLVIATGVRDRTPSIEGFDEHYGSNVFHCAACDGYETQGKHVVALGWSANVAGFAVGLLDWAASVTVVTNGARFEGDEQTRAALAAAGVPIVEASVASCDGVRGDLHGVTLADGRRLPCEVMFFSIGHDQRDPTAADLGCAINRDGCVVVDDTGAATVPGVYAAGDITPGLHLIQVAAASGTVAGIGAAQSLRGDRTVAWSPPPAPRPESVVHH